MRPKRARASIYVDVFVNTEDEVEFIAMAKEAVREVCRKIMIKKENLTIYGAYMGGCVPWEKLEERKDEL